ncbi:MULTISPECIES: ABC transporter permease [Pontibacillus]|uniref:ABC transporter permease subunit n=1 Tax=Pontibacillus chungwhensis TaxID=265426 RepID=A0ABY8UUG3_9BACI|nr:MULTISPECIES: ABC transporter permease subunit [Pontibacillus]MCD5323461.1 ABC transporter permease subunit [Pontibacillus sp. HN14]WIF96838.1 ABC transporter permease subunit [Pontibacillus chungwhensis]
MNRIRQMNVPLYVGFFLVLVFIFLAIAGPKIAPHSLDHKVEVEYQVIDGKGIVVAPPVEPFTVPAYPLGTDKFGYDLVTKLLHGAKYTIGIAVVTALLKMVTGSIIGLYAGTLKSESSWWKAVENSVSYIPAFLILYFVLQPITINPDLESMKLIFIFIILMTILSLPSTIASVRKQTREIVKKEYVDVARTLGARRNRLVWKHIFPQLKEGLLIMFVMEIVFVMTVMGQLGIFHLFMGGTIKQTNPTLYLSMTNEWAGLIGQSRGHIFGNQYILMVPLVALVLATSSFVLLARGLQNHFQTDCQKAPWIPTGSSSHQPLPKVKMKIGKRITVTPGFIIMAVFLFVFTAGLVLVMGEVV